MTRPPDGPSPASRATSSPQAGLAAVGAIVSGCLATFGLALCIQWRMITRTPAFMGALDPDSIRVLGRAALAIELEDVASLVAIRGGPIELRRDDIGRILDTAFEARAYMTEAARVHAGTLALLHRFPRDPVLRLAIEDARPPLAVSASLYIRRRLGALPDCNVLQDAGALFKGLRQKLFGDHDDEAFARSLPRCRPPGPVESAVVRGVNGRLVRFAASGPDSVTLFRIGAADSTFTRWAHAARRTGLVLGGPSLLALGPLLGLLGVLFVNTRLGRGRAALRDALLAGALTFVLLALFARFYAGSVEALARLPIPGGRGATDADRAWNELATYALRAVTRRTARLGFAAGFALATMAALASMAAFRRGGGSRRGCAQSARFEA